MSSITIIFFRLAIFVILSTSVEFPRTCTSIITLVLFVIFFIKSFELTFSESLSTSTNTGFNPAWTRGHKDVDQHTDGIRTSSPTLNLLFLMGLQAANETSRFAEDPELTISAYFEPIFLAKFFSNSFVFLDIVNCPETITFMPDMRSSVDKAFSNRG